jgi:hypothetical protein
MRADEKLTAFLKLELVICRWLEHRCFVFVQMKHQA